MANQTLVSLDVGEKRIGVSVADTGVRIAVPLLTIAVDGTELEQIGRIIDQQHADVLVIGYPRNQSGEPTAQTNYVELFAEKLKGLEVKLAFQDESLTSVIAKQRLEASGKPYERDEIDSQAASIILQDYLEVHYG